MDGAGDEVLAHPALAAEHHGRIGSSDVLDHRPDRPHRDATIEQRSVLGGIHVAVGPVCDRFRHRSAALVERSL